MNIVPVFLLERTAEEKQEMLKKAKGFNPKVANNPRFHSLKSMEVQPGQMGKLKRYLRMKSKEFDRNILGVVLKESNKKVGEYDLEKDELVFFK